MKIKDNQTIRDLLHAAALIGRDRTRTEPVEIEIVTRNSGAIRIRFMIVSVDGEPVAETPTNTLGLN